MDNSKSIVFCDALEVLDSNQEVLKDVCSDIKLFKIELSQYYQLTDILLKALTSEEVKRAQRYHQLKDSNRFIICRALLKYVIAEEKGLDISQIHFEKKANHKPYFPLDRSLFFNVSHAGDFAVIALGNCELGIDVEQIDSNFKYSDILSSVFSVEEINFISHSEFERRTFYKFWTRKEAIVKATGKGIDEEFINIPVLDGAHFVSSSLVDGFKNIEVHSFNLNADHTAAIAYTDKNKGIIFCKIPKAETLLTFFNE
ncbi:4'-phosphopantetheinyl transferase family protein [Winogradskyella wichelsiae]|uniref:4'-phosphopantetheinyl transferase family protein n=1 Tax=Winogradskyella wichelsiae TaxID=2697007 RepID=UPI003EF12203